MTTDDRLSTLLLQWEEERSRGRDLSAAELCQECPELEAELAERIGVLRRMNALLLPKEESDDIFSNRCPTHDISNRATGLDDSDSKCSAGRQVPAIPGYEVISEIGRGGMGVVYKAQQVKLNRTVALKLILSRAHAGTEATARFIQEAETIAQLKHPNIVQIYEFGNHAGDAFFSLEFLEGGTLTERLRGEPQPPMQAAGTVATLSRAIQSAHEQKIIHRDLKPDNVLMTADGVLKVTDFGLAKQIDSAMTATGAVMGTPSYMSPEQAAGNAKDIGPATDIYALGAILYEMLTGRPPFKGVSPWDTVQMVITAEPVPPRQLNVQVPRDLETICLKCLHKEPGRRYQSATDLADDLWRFQTGEPIRARPVGTGERAWKWACRRPAVAALIGFVIIASSLFLGVGFWFSAEMGAAGVAIKVKEERLKDAERLAQTHEFFGFLRAAEKRSAQTQSGWTWANVQDLSKAAGLAPATEHATELRSAAASALGAIDARQIASVGEGLHAASLAFHPDGSMLALGPFATPLLSEGRVHLINIHTKIAIRTLIFDPEFVLDPDFGIVHDGIFSLAFSPDGRFLIAGARSGKLHCWDLSRESHAAFSWNAHNRTVRSLCFSPDGRFLYSSGSGDDKTVKRWALQGSGEPGLQLGCDLIWKARLNIENIAVHPTEGWLICGMIGAHTQCLSGETLQPIRPEMGISGISCFAPHGDAIVDGDLGITCLRSGRKLRPLSLPDGETVHINSLAFNKQGTMLVSVSNPAKKVYLWEMANCRLAAELYIGTGNRIVADVSPDGRLIAVTADAKTLLYEVGGITEQSFVAMNSLPILSVGLHPDGQSLACQTISCWGTDFNDVTIWPLDKPVCLQATARHSSHGNAFDGPSVCFQPSSRNVAWISGGNLHCQDCAGKYKRQTIVPAKTGSHILDGQLCSGADGRLWTTIGPELRIWNTADFKDFLHWDIGLKGTLSGLASLYAVDPRQRWAAVGGRDGSVRLFHTTKESKKTLGAVREIAISKAPIRAVAFNREESLLAAGSDNGDLCILAPTGTVLAKETPHFQGVKGLSWSANGLLASGSHDRTVKIWSCIGGSIREVLTLRQPGPVRWLKFHPDGVRLYVLLEREHAVRVWHLDRLFAHLKEIGLDAGMDQVAPNQEGHSSQAASDSSPDQPIIEPAPNANGLKAEIYDDLELQHCVKVRYDKNIDSHFGNNAADPVLRPAWPLSIRWSGCLKAPSPGKYTLQLESDDGARLWLDGKRLFDRWQRSYGKPQANIELSGRPQSLRIELINMGGGGLIHFRWAKVGTALQPVPNSALYHDATAKRTQF